MKKAVLCATAAALTLSAVPASAAPLLYDGFNYTAGEKLAPRTDTTVSPNPGQLNVDYSVNWRYAGAGGTTNEAPGIANGTLSTPGLAASTGNSVAFDQTMIGSSRLAIPGGALTISNAPTVYWSGLLRVNTIDPAMTSATTAGGGMLLGALNNSTGPGTLPTVLGGHLVITRDASDANNTRYFVGTAVNGSNREWATGLPQNAGDTVFIVISYQFVSGVNNDVAKMWINPNPLDFGAITEPTPTITKSGTGADPFTQIASVNLRNVNTVGNPDVQFDELRVGTTWADVTPVPEPGSLAFVALGTAGLIARRRRHGRRA